MVWIIVFSIIVGFGTRQNRILAEDGQQAHDAVCALKADLRLRIKSQDTQIARSEEFIKNNPNGIPGISIKILNDSLSDSKQVRTNTQNTLTALGVVVCGEGDSTR